MKIDLSEIGIKKKEFRDEINKLYEEKSKHLIGKFFKNSFMDQWGEPQTSYLYIHSNKGMDVIGIEFNVDNLQIIRVGYTLDYFEKWELVDLDKVINIKKKLIEFFHLKEIFGGYL